MPTAVITGATSGSLGPAFATHLARAGYDLTPVARTEQGLAGTADRLRHPSHRVTTMAADLVTGPGSRRLTGSPAQTVPDLLAKETLLQLNIGCVLRTTQTVLPGMMQRDSGAVVNVASVAAYGPTWPAGAYPARKSWVLAFTESIARSASVRSSRVRIRVLLPSYIRTAFHQRVGLEVGQLPSWMWLSSEQVVTAAIAMRNLVKGRLVSIPSRCCRACACGIGHLPQTLTSAFRWHLGRNQSVLPPPEAPRTADIAT
ncbi:SDR family NAD(P)-dependent oxidoreductase [Streptomyces sp. NPDC057474]|uniref:SDR family NAD(P)-dependent oxidoreductase n=1 Tax=Streptomyces sp. NPDC057474 TaxID=3346144 RepID=UPI0036C6A589